MARPFDNRLQFVHSLPRFYAGRILLVDSTYGSNTYVGDDPAQPLKSITYAVSKCVDGHDDLILVMPGYNNDNTDTETNGDDTPITVNKNDVTILFQGRSNTVQAIASADSIFKIDANNVTIGVLPNGAIQVAAAAAGTTSTVVEIAAAAVNAEVFGFKNVDGADMDNYDELFTVAATAHGAWIHDIDCVGNTTDTDEGIMIEGTVDGLHIGPNVRLVSCGAGNGNIYSNSVHTNCHLHGILIDERVASKKGINFNAAATGQIHDCRVYTAADANAIINGSCAEWENYVNDALTTSGFISPAAGTIT